MAPSSTPIRTDPEGIRSVLARLGEPCYVVESQGQFGLSPERPGAGARLVAVAPPCRPGQLGSAAFRSAHRLEAAYVAGAMAGGIASTRLVTSLAAAGYLASFGAGGLSLNTVETRVTELVRSVGGRPFMVNLLYAPHDQELEFKTVELLLRHGVHRLEASAFLDITASLVWFRLSGLARRGGRVAIGNRIMAKVSRIEIGRKFLQPAPPKLVSSLLDRGLITAEQAELAGSVPMADDITVEADSGGHTDGRPLVALLPLFAHEREALARKFRPAGSVRFGAAGGIGTPEAAAAAFALGADYVVTGSVNQTCVEADLSDRAKTMLVAAEVTDFDLAPSADMFEIGSQVQVLKRGTMFAARAQRLRQLYDRYGSLDALSTADREWLEQKILCRSIDAAWADVRDYLGQNQPGELTRCEDPRRKMALLFRWYLGLSSRWAREGVAERAVDYQLWAGPALGAFNHWAAGSCLAALRNRTAGEVAANLMLGAAFTTRVVHLRTLGVRLPVSATTFRPIPDCETALARLAK
ncbi:PfaD family polyunsaturated fatty acid/polyketide biosynthesis protein [Nocardia sp. NPDC101769]|uniref:PfaD family polyunsaturated fatty acid/polyketide biosynthesis protein n=1 Tax=Nocardia sp. NPDC101769 TaxID=3364333 RepID=UPI0037F88FC8